VRPVRLEVKGFSAFRDEAVVDFSGVELLALVGPTGSGKSSVIDAMTFALYGSAARYGERDVAPVVNQLSAEARVRFTFEVAGVEYSATRVVRRTKTGASTKEARLERGADVLAGDAKGMSEAVTKLLGLDFQRFNKTVVLPQGRFAEFLYDKPSDRQALLQELFGFGIYEDLGRRARELASRKRNDADVRERSIEELGDLSDEHLADLEAAVWAASRALVEFDGLAARQEAADRDLGELDRRTADLASRRKLLAEIVVPDGVLELSDRLAEAQLAEQQASTARDDARAKFRAAQGAVVQGPDLLVCQQLIDAYERRTVLSEQLDAQQLEVNSAERQLASVRADAQRARDEIAQAKATVQGARSRRDEAAQRAEQAGDRAVLVALLAAHDRLAEIAEQLTEQQREVGAAEAEAATASESLTAAREHCERVERLQPALALAAHLHVGEACPVCLHRVEQLPTHRAADDSDLRHARERASAAEHACRAAEQQLAEARAHAASLAKERTKLEAQISGAADRGQAQAQLELVDRLQAEAAEAQRLAGDAEAQCTAIESDPTRARAISEEQNATMALATSRAVHERMSDELDALGAQLHGKPDEASVRASADEARQLATAVDEAQRLEEAAEQSHAAYARARAEVEAAEREARQDFDAARESVIALKPPRSSGSLASDWTGLAAWSVGQTAEHDAQLVELTEQTITARQERDAVAAAIDELVEGLVDDARAPLTDVRAGLIRAESDARHDVQRLVQHRERAVQVSAEVAALRDEAAVAEELGGLLRANGFPRWLLEEAMHDLVDRATVRLRELTSDQYSLVADDGAFKIVDHRNANEIRDARSLSGGETFLTSLSLALALADSTVELAAEGAAPMESIFLDEGFGTLDPGALEVVAGTIEELGASGRMVGIVTHIRDLAERMPTRVEITKGPNGSVLQRVDV
jgi:exonuclease SbcC